MDVVLSATGISKSYGSVRANVEVDVDVRCGEVHAILGENGAGKSTLMRILYGMEVPDAGLLELSGQPILLRSPRDSIKHGIGMVHQHFMLVPTLTVLENLMLGNEIAGRGVLKFGAARAHISELARRFHIAVDLDRKVGQLSVGEQQRVEILKVLVRRAKILILDEPTAVLMPQEITDLMVTLRQLAHQGFSIFLVTHKLAEAMEVSNRVSVMRAGHKVGTWKTDETTPDALIAHMIGRGRDVHLTRRPMPESAPVLQLQALQVEGDRGIDALRGLSLAVRAGEILGIAGVEGNGQRELGEVITGLRQLKSGDILFDGQSIRDVPTIEVLRRGIGFVPEDRHHDALVLQLSVAENAVLVSHADAPFDRRGLIVSEAITAFTGRLIEEFRMRCNGTNLAVRKLSGGNQQKLVLGREIARNPRLLIAMQPTRGLDVGAIDYVHSRLIDARNAGTAILLISTELDEVMAVSDRIAVLREGRIAGVLSRTEANMDVIGRMMLGASGGAAAA
jgi:general nucleoside transport system ATP-binding protein